MFARVHPHPAAIVKDAHQAIVPAHPDLLLEEVEGNRIEGALYLDEAVHVHQPGADLEHVEAGPGERLEGGLFDLQEVGKHLASSGAVDAQLGHLVPAAQELVVGFQALEVPTLERVLDVGAGALLDALLLRVVGLGGSSTSDSSGRGTRILRT